MKKKILSALLSASLILGIIGVNAVSIEFEDLDSFDEYEYEVDETNDIETNNNVENDNGIDEINYYIEDEIVINAVDDVLEVESIEDNIMFASEGETESYIGYFTNADNIY